MHTGMRIVAVLTLLLGLVLLTPWLGAPLVSGMSRGMVQGIHIMMGIALAMLAPLAMPRNFEIAKRPGMTKWAWLAPWVPLVIGILMILGVLSIPTWVWIHALAGIGAISLLEIAGARRKPTE